MQLKKFSRARMAGNPQWSQWWIATASVKPLWERQPTFVIPQLVYIATGMITLLHAFRKGGRWPYFWLATVLHGFYAVIFWHFVLPENDNFWHSQTPVIVFGKCLSLHIILLYPAFVYHAAYAVSRLNLTKSAEPFAVGLLTVLIDMPCDVVGVKFVRVTGYIFERHYWVPWKSFYYHATFSASLYYFFITCKKWLVPFCAQWRCSSIAIELQSLRNAALLGMLSGVLLYITIYRPLNYGLEIHSEVIFFLLIALFATPVFNATLQDRPDCVDRLTTIDFVLISQLALHYLTYWVLAVFFDPELEVSETLHEPVEQCNNLGETTSLKTLFGQTLYKRKYICPDAYDVDYFDIGSADETEPPVGDTWCTTCGAPFLNRGEYIAAITGLVFFAAGIFRGIYFANTAALPVARRLKF